MVDVKQLREKLGATQKELGQFLLLDRVQVADMEREKAKISSATKNYLAILDDLCQDRDRKFSQAAVKDNDNADLLLSIEEKLFLVERELHHKKRRLKRMKLDYDNVRSALYYLQWIMDHNQGLNRRQGLWIESHHHVLSKHLLTIGPIAQYHLESKCELLNMEIQLHKTALKRLG